MMEPLNQHCAVKATILLLINLLLTNGVRCGPVALRDNAGEGDQMLSLSLSSGVIDPQSTPSSRLQNALQRILNNDDCRKEFEVTEQALNFVSEALETFAKQEGINPESAANNEARVISFWLSQKANGVASLGPQSEKIAQELDYVFSNFWTQFKQLINSIINDRPAANLGTADLAFRCERHDQLIALKQMASVSPIYGLLFDVFASELYSHCLRRKLAVIELYQVKPSPILQQFVDIYLDLPTSSALARSNAIRDKNILEQESVNQLQAGLALHFDLQASIAKHGPLNSVAPLIIGLFLNDNGNRDLITKFKLDCQYHANQLSQIWSSLDQLAAFMSTTFNDLSQFNNLVKLVRPQLVYGAICAQLVQTE